MSIKLERLIEALRLIAAPAGRQIEILANMGHFEGRETDASGIDGQWNVDEIGLQFEDTEIFLPELLRLREINPNDSESIVKLSSELSARSGIENSSFWTIDALINDPEWENIRRSAQECLKGLGSLH